MIGFEKRSQQVTAVHSSSQHRFKPAVIALASHRAIQEPSACNFISKHSHNTVTACCNLLWNFLGSDHSLATRQTRVKNCNLAIWRTDRRALRRSFALHFRPAGPIPRTPVSFGRALPIESHYESLWFDLDSNSYLTHAQWGLRCSYVFFTCGSGAMSCGPIKHRCT